MPKMIGVGISSSDVGGHPLSWALARAARTGADVVLLHVLDDVDGEVRGRVGSPRDAAAHLLLAEQVRSARASSPSTSVHSRVLRGNAIWQLVAASADLDLLVVGTHKTGFIHGTVYGSRTLPLAAEAACPVVIIPAPSRVDRADVMVGADDSRSGRAALRFAADEAASTGEELTILRIWSPSADQVVHAGEAGRRSAEEFVARCAFEALRRHADLRVRTRALGGSPAPVLIAASSGSLLLVLGDAQTPLREPPALGVVSHDALINIKVPTMIVHGRDGSAAEDPQLLGLDRPRSWGPIDLQRRHLGPNL